MSDWTGDLNDDCWLERYGMLAHVECMHRGCWWFAITTLPSEAGRQDLYNTGDNNVPVRLTTGKMARAAAEVAMEILRK